MELALDHSLRCALPGRSCYNVDGVVGGERSNSTTPTINERGHHLRTVRDTHLPIDGAEEADIVQTDGQDIIGIFDQYVVSSRAWPPEDLHEVAHVRLPGTLKSLYLEGDHIVVLSHLHGAPYPQAYRDRHARNADDNPFLPAQTHTAYNVYGWPVDGTLLMRCISRRAIGNGAGSGVQKASVLRRYGHKFTPLLSKKKPAQTRPTSDDRYR